MARYRADQIYAFAREAGFSPDQAATMTAIALAESGGRSDAHNPRNEDSRGLWQINVDAHGEKFGNLYDPVQNAKAAFAVSQNGADISPWTTSHGGMSARYLRFKAEAEAAAASYGDGPGRGMWEGTSGYGDHTPAGDPRGGGQPATGQSTTGSGSDNVNVSTAPGATASATVTQPGEEYGIALDSEIAVQGMGDTGTPVPTGEEYGIALDSEVPAAPTQPGTPDPSTTAPQAMAQTAQPAESQTQTGGDSTKLQVFLDAAVAQTGDQYVFGAPTDPNDPNPSTFDCSELVEWASAQAGVTMPDGSWIQYQHLAKGGHIIPVEQAINTPGALLFSFSSDPLASSGRPKSAHVAISLGDGKTIEAKGTDYGVGSWDATTKRFQYAAVIPELSGVQGTTPMAAPAEATPTDTFNHRVATDPVDMDNSPATVAASHALTGAEPPPMGATPEPPPPPPEPVLMGDVDQDGMDDALQNATDFATGPDDGSAFGIESDVDDFNDSSPAH